MGRCPVRKGGRHSLAAVLPESSDGYMTLFCESCGAVRRLPVSGEVSVPPDCMTPAQLDALFARKAP